MTINDLIGLSGYTYDEIRIGVKGIDEFETLYSYDGFRHTVSPALQAKNVISYAVKAIAKQRSMYEITLEYVLFIQIDT